MTAPAASVVRVSDCEILITRAFAAEAARVYEAWTNPELVRRWWAPAGRGVTMLVCEAEVAVGGRYRYVIGGSGGDQYAFSGTYLELAPPGRLVYTQVFEAFPDGEATVTVTFEEHGGVTTMTAHERYPSKEALDGALLAGMEEGMAETYAQLDALLAS